MSDTAEKGVLEHLKSHRRLIIERSVLAGLVGLVPVPVIDDLLTGLVKGRLVRRLADERQVDLTPSAVLILGEERQVTMARNATITAISLVALRYAWRKVFVALALSRRVEEMVHTFQVGTLFDHYCARHHVGAGVQGPDAARLRFAMDQAITAVHHEIAAEAFKKSGTAIGRTATRLPGGLWGIVSRLWRRPAAAPAADAAEIVDEVTESLEREGLLRKAARIVEEEMGAAGSAYVGALVSRFDAIYAQLLQQEAATAPAKEGAAPPAGGDAGGGTPPPKAPA